MHDISKNASCCSEHFIHDAARHCGMTNDASTESPATLETSLLQKGFGDTYSILSALRMVDRRCAITRTVCLCIILSRASCTTASLSASSADVASSNNRMVGLRTRALAMAIRCFCPPERATPLSPQSCKSSVSSRQAWTSHNTHSKASTGASPQNRGQ